ncbi:hypothetical protein P4V86_05240 [Brevibacillus laterosporus]|uniref:hypothetical protein n=1 Tax=Brevibacillus laterosporus TaxID=1465 RepID=UPI000375F6A4|nr:hypothetical protein [Brevibacillus laterosporus]ATO51421.1 hypothetical protein BrL25_21355 [Brevibacillus laterosporus DSM 25]MED2002761.1 hypothetical protein [Brevibacillus laterosporus]
MKKSFISSIAMSAVLVTGLVQPTFATESETRLTIPQNTEGLSALMQSGAINEDGTIIQALRADEIKKALANDGMETSGKIDGVKAIKVHEFEDGSKIRVTTHMITEPSPNRGISTQAKEEKEEKVTGYTTYTLESAIGVELWTYTLYQKVKIKKERVTWYEKNPYTKWKTSNILNAWHLDHETYHNDPEGNDVRAIVNSKLSWGIRDIINLQNISLRGELLVRGDGTYTGGWKEL